MKILIRIAIIAAFASLYVLTAQAQTVKLSNETVVLGQSAYVSLDLFTPNNSIDTVNFSVAYDSALLTFQEVLRGTDISPTWTFTTILDTSQPGKVGISIKLNVRLSNRIHFAVLRFTTNSNTGSSTLVFGDQPTPRLTAGNTSFSSTYSDSVVNIIVPTGARILRAVDSRIQISLTGTMNIELIAQGNENAIGFSLLLPADRLQYVQAVLGSDAQGATLNLNTVFAPKIGFAVSLPAGQAFQAGTRIPIVVTLRATKDSNNQQPGKVRVYLGDYPIIREIGGVDASSLSTVFQSAEIDINLSYEGDVSPRPTGNQVLSVTDWVQVGRFAAALDVPAEGLEFQKADCAPLNTFGNGAVNIADWVQAGRYAAAFDGPFQAQGPDRPTASFQSLNGPTLSSDRLERIPDNARRVTLSRIDMPEPRNSRTEMKRYGSTEIHYAVNLQGRGDENALAFTLEIPDGLRLINATPASGAILHINDRESGRLGVAIALAPGKSFAVGETQVLTLRFSSNGGAPSIQFTDDVVRGEVVTIDAQNVPAVFGTEAAREIRRR